MNLASSDVIEDLSDNACLIPSFELVYPYNLLNASLNDGGNSICCLSRIMFNASPNVAFFLPVIF